MEHKLWINGQWQDTKGGSLMSIEDPATGKGIAEVINASREDVDRAVQAAKAAFYVGRWS
jgi:betaine-aldehyde dehydrogenase